MVSTEEQVALKDSLLRAPFPSLRSSWASVPCFSSCSVCPPSPDALLNGLPSPRLEIFTTDCCSFHLIISKSHDHSSETSGAPSTNMLLVFVYATLYAKGECSSASILCMLAHCPPLAYIAPSRFLISRFCWCHIMCTSHLALLLLTSSTYSHAHIPTTALFTTNYLSIDALCDLLHVCLMAFSSPAGATARLIRRHERSGDEFLRVHG